MKKYDFKAIEAKWQKAWEKANLYKAKGKGKKFYSLIEFPYPSGDGLHVGHVRSNTAMDIVSRKRRMEGFDVLYPIGWDAFGLPTENYAIKTGVDPAVATKKNTDTFRRQLKALGFSFDWSREVNTTDPGYYKWTQWMFLQFFKKGLAYKASSTINWCPKDKIGLANEEAVGGVCDRCGSKVEKRMKEQWMLRITAYADKLLAGLKDVDYIPQARIQQENWIGRSEGALITFKLRGISGQSDDKHVVEVFTTRPDTLFGATFVVVSPELAQKWLAVGWQTTTEVKKYVEESIAKRGEAEAPTLADGEVGAPTASRVGEKTGVFAGIYAINPANQEKVPVWVADYVLSTYGTGAIMAVPAHDERDFEFAKKFNLPIRKVIKPAPIVYAIRNARDIASGAQSSLEIQSECWIGDGIMINSGTFNDLSSEKARWAITDFVGGKRKTQYKLRDWVFSRQRYWGEPIPLVHCSKDGWVPVPDKDLPVKLPKVKNYKPRDDGQSPLASVEKWVNVKCPQCKGPAKRETDTMPNWAGSSWYFLRYTDPKNSKEFASKKALTYFTSVDWYNGGMEHTVLHLLYSRFWNRFLYDQKLVPTAEPYKKRTSHGLILAAGGVKMSKSKGNVVNPDDIVKKFGADALRLYEMFIGPFDQPVAWDERGVVGTSRFLERVWRIYNANATNKETNATDKEPERLLHQTIKKVSEDIESMSFNTAVSALMILLNAMEKNRNLQPATRNLFLKLLAPFAPHIAEELWANLESNPRRPEGSGSRPKASEKKSIHLEKWPTYDPKLLVSETFTLVIQINGKTRDTVEAPVGISDADARALALGRDKVRQTLAGATPKKTIYVPGRLISFVL